MEELVKIHKSKGGKDVVSARELYQFLGASERFSSWYERQLGYGFTEGVDYIGCKVFNTLANQTLDDFSMTIDMAKEISMIQRTEKGKQARQYFIACEKRLREIAQAKFQIPKTLSEALLLAANQAKQIEEQSRQIAADAPKVAFADAVSTAETDILVRDLAKLIAQNGFVIGEHRLYKWMVQKGYLEERKRWSARKGKHEVQYWPTQRAIDLKIFRVKETVIQDGTPMSFLKPTVKVNPKGQQYFINKFLTTQQ